MQDVEQQRQQNKHCHGSLVPDGGAERLHRRCGIHQATSFAKVYEQRPSLAAGRGGARSVEDRGNDRSFHQRSAVTDARG
jgi:hypothetical protein